MQNRRTTISTNVLIDLERKKFNVHEIHTDENKRKRNTADLQTSIQQEIVLPSMKIAIHDASTN